MSFKIEIFMNKFWNNKIVYLQSLNKINSIHKLCINRFFILKKLIVLFCFVLFQSILFSQTNQSENEIVSDIKIYKLSTKYEPIFKLLDTIIDLSEDCYFYRENVPHYYDIFFRDSNNVEIELRQIESYKNFKGYFELNMTLGYRQGGFLYKNNLFIFKLNFGLFYFEKDSTLMKIDDCIKMFNNNSIAVNSLSYYNEYDLDKKVFYCTKHCDKFSVFYATQCVQKKEDIPLIPSDEIGHYLKSNKSESRFDLIMFSPYTDTLITGQSTVLLEFENNDSFCVKKIIGIKSIYISRLLFENSKYRGTQDLLSYNDESYSDYSLYEKEQISYYLNEIPKLIDQLVFYNRHPDLYQKGSSRIQPVSISFSILPK